VWGQEGDDDLSVVYGWRGELDGRYLAHVEGGDGNDTIRAWLNPAAGSTGTVGDPSAPADGWNRYLDLYGGAGDDEIELDFMNNGTGMVYARMFGGDGIDTLALDATGPGIIFQQWS
jgi:hypothetical protein